MYCCRKSHCKLATLSPGKKSILPSRRYFSLSPAGRQRLQFYNEFIKWWPSANNFQCCPRAFGPRATLEIIGFGSPLDKASLYRSKPPLSKATLVDIPWGPERLFRPLLPGRQHWFTKTKSTTILWRAMLPGRQHCYSQRRQAAGDELGLVTSQATMINHCCLTGYIASYLLSLWIPMLPAR